MGAFTVSERRTLGVREPNSRNSPSPFARFPSPHDMDGKRPHLPLTPKDALRVDAKERACNNPDNESNTCLPRKPKSLLTFLPSLVTVS